MIYQVPAPTEPLVQGDVLDDCPVYRHNDGMTPDAFLARVVVLTQTCDIEQVKGPRLIVAVIHPAAELVQLGEVKASNVRDQIRRGQSFGYYFLPASAAVPALPESLVALRDLHTVPRATLAGLVAQGRRVCRIPVPYREHLAQHFAVTYMRIALPEPYPTAP